jgi:hypothetical protein
MTFARMLAPALLLAVSDYAATYAVKAGGGGDYTTIQACANAMSNGDTCVVYAGTYNEHVSVPAGGVGAYKTLQVTGTDLVYVYDFALNSHNKLIGFHIQNPSSPNSADCVSIGGIGATTTDVYVTGNTFYACGYHAMIYESYSSTSSYIYIQNNTLSYPCSTSASPNACMAISINGNYHLIENNDISHTSDGMNLFGSHNIIRKNTFHDNTTSDCGSNSSNCHIDFIQSEPNTNGGYNPPTQYNVIEENTELNNLGSDGHAYLAQADYCSGQCYNLIIRFNVGAHVGSAGIVDNNDSDSADPGFYSVKSYNNTWIDYANYSANQPYGVTNSFVHNSTHAAEINDLFYYPESLADFNPYITDSTTSGTFSVKNNLAYCTASPCNLHGQIYGSGAFTSDPGNLQVDPQFVNYTNNDFRLAAGSPAIGAGTYLTTVATTDSGSGISMVVNDASFFQDGYGVMGVNADCISVTTVTNHVCITGVNYQTNTLTLASSITRSAGDPLWLYSDSTGRTVLIGGAPNIGATFGSTPVLAPPTSVTAVIH